MDRAQMTKAPKPPAAESRAARLLVLDSRGRSARWHAGPAGSLGALDRTETRETSQFTITRKEVPSHDRDRPHHPGRHRPLCNSHHGKQRSRKTAWAMSEENVEVVRRCNRFWGEGDFVLASELFDPEVVIDFSQNVFNPDVYHGYEGLMRLVTAVHEMWDTFKVETEEVIDAGETVVAAVRQRRPQRGRHPDAGLPSLDAARREGAADEG